MAWITFKEAVKEAGISRTTGQTRVRQLKKLDLLLYKKLIKEGKPMMVEATQGVAYFRTDIRKFKNRLEALESKPGRKSNQKAEPVPLDHKDMLADLMEQTVVLAVEPDVETILKSIIYQDERDRLMVVIKICYDYAVGYDTLDQCITRYGASRTSFHRWLRNSAHLAHIYKRAKSERNKVVKERDVEGSIDVIRKLMYGYMITEERKRYKVVTGYSGNEILMPESVDITQKHFQPNLGAAIYMSTNRDPENWRRHTPFEELFKDKEKITDRFERMTPKELDDYLAKAEKMLGKKK